jgi:hypothetical protein
MDLQIKQQIAQTKAQQAQADQQLKSAEQQRKQQKDLMDAAAKADELELRKAQISGQQQLEAARLGVDIEKHKADKEAEGTRLGVDIAKSREAAEFQRNRPLLGKE